MPMSPCPIIQCVFRSISFLLVFFPMTVHAFQVSLTWDANTEPDLAGYRVFARQEGQSYDYNSPVYEGTGRSCTVPDLMDGITYYFVARAFDTQGFESADSEEVPAHGEGLPPPQYTLSVSTNGDGTVEMDPPGGVYDSGTRVTLTGVPSDGWSFGTWNGAATGSSNPTTVMMDTDQNVLAVFTEIAPIQYSVAIDTQGAGTVTLSPPGGAYDDGTVLMLMASPAEGWIFSHWSGAVSSSDNPAALLVDGHKIVTAIFTQAPSQTYQLSLNIEGSGSVTIDPPGGVYESGTIVALTAMPATDWVFSGWNDALMGMANPETIVMDGDKEVSAIFRSANQSPVADAGPDQRVEEGQRVQLNGSGSFDADNAIVTYRWWQRSGTPVTLSDINAVSPSFVAPDVGMQGDILTFRLTVKDATGRKDFDKCRVYVSWINAQPYADAGPDQTVMEGQSVSLSGLNSIDPDDGIASYHWQQIDGIPVTIAEPNTAQPTFTAPNVGIEGASLRFALSVYDQSGLESTDQCLVNIIWQNEPPVADAGPDQIVPESSLVTLDGRDSLDVDDGITSFSWVQIGGNSVALNDATSEQPYFWTTEVGPEGESLTFELTITDSDGLMARDECVVNVTWQNDPPVAVAQDYIEAMEHSRVQLDGLMSTDGDDGIAGFLWTQTEGVPVVLSDPTSARPTFDAPEAGEQGITLGFRLTVSDHGMLQDTDDCLVYIQDADEPTDTVNIIYARYISSRQALYVRATSDAPAGMVTLKLVADYDAEQNVELGQLNPSSRSRTRQNAYWGFLYSPHGRPNRVMVVSSGGGADTTIP